MLQLDSLLSLGLVSQSEMGHGTPQASKLVAAAYGHIQIRAQATSDQHSVNQEEILLNTNA